MNFVSEDVSDPDRELVQTVCLDQFCYDHSIDNPDLLKLDVKGHEHSALKGRNI
jgi:FkbM family methyltransferase